MRSGAGVWVADNHPINKSIRVPGLEQSNQTGELAAILVALQSVPPTTKLTLVTDSQYAIKMLTRSLPDLEDASWTNTPNAQWIQATAYHLRARGAPTLFKWVKGHEGTLGNEQADRLAATGANKPAEDNIDLTVPNHFRQSGLRRNNAGQSLCIYLEQKPASPTQVSGEPARPDQGLHRTPKPTLHHEPINLEGVPQHRYSPHSTSFPI